MLSFLFDSPPQQAKNRLHVALGIALLTTFILVIARVAVPGTPAVRTNTWGIAVCLKSGVFLAYQLLTSHTERFKKWASAKAYMILNIIDVVFWFALLIITGMGTVGGKSAASRALGGVIMLLVVILLAISSALSIICTRAYRQYKTFGTVAVDKEPR